MAQPAEDLCPYTAVCSSDNEVEWLASRMTGLGASEAAGVCGESQWDSPYAIWARKIGAVPDTGDEKECMRWGHLLEPVILHEYQRRTGRTVRPSGMLLRSVAYPWALATLDGETRGDNEPWFHPLEIKTTNSYNADAWKDGPPRANYLQIQQQMLVTGAATATTACLIGGQRFVWADIERDEVAIAKIVARGTELWQHVIDRTPPEVDGSEATSEALSAMFSAANDDVVSLAADLLDIADELEQEKAATKARKARIDELENRIKAALGRATRGILPDGRGFTYGTTNRAGFFVQPTSFRVLRATKGKR